MTDMRFAADVREVGQVHFAADLVLVDEGRDLRVLQSANVTYSSARYSACRRTLSIL